MQIGNNIDNLMGLPGAMPVGMQAAATGSAETSGWNAVLGEVLSSIAGQGGIAAGLKGADQMAAQETGESAQLSGTTQIRAGSELDGLLRKLLAQLEALLKQGSAHGEVLDNQDDAATGAADNGSLKLSCGPLQVEYNGEKILLDFDLPQADAKSSGQADAAKDQSNAAGKLRKLPSPEEQLLAALAGLLRMIEQQLAPQTQAAQPEAQTVAVDATQGARVDAQAEQAGTNVATPERAATAVEAEQPTGQHNVPQTGLRADAAALESQALAGASTAVSAAKSVEVAQGQRANQAATSAGQETEALLADGARSREVAIGQGATGGVTAAQPGVAAKSTGPVQAEAEAVVPLAGQNGRQILAGERTQNQEQNAIQHLSLCFKLADGSQQKLKLELSQPLQPTQPFAGAALGARPLQPPAGLQLLEPPLQRVAFDAAASKPQQLEQPLAAQAVELSLLPHFGQELKLRAADLRPQPRLELMAAEASDEDAAEPLRLLANPMEAQAAAAKQAAVAMPVADSQLTAGDQSGNSAEVLQQTVQAEALAGLKAERQAHKRELIQESAELLGAELEAQPDAAAAVLQTAAVDKPLERARTEELLKGSGLLPQAGRADKSSADQPGGASGEGSFELPLQLAQFSQPLAQPELLGRGMISGAMLQRMGDLAQEARKAGNGDYQATLRLDPPSLGRVEISIMVQGNSVSMQFSSSNGQARRELRESISGLKQSLTEAGLNVADIDVVELDPFTGAADSDGGRGEGQAQRDSAAAEHALWHSQGAAAANAAQQFEWRGLLAAQLNR